MRLLLIFALLFSAQISWGQGSLGAGNDEFPQVGTPISPSTTAGGAGTGAAPSGPSGGSPDTLFPSIDTTPLDTRNDDLTTPQAQEVVPDRDERTLPDTGTGIGTGLDTPSTSP